MLTLLKDWKGEVDINDKHYNTIQDATSDFKSVNDVVHIRLSAQHKNVSKRIVQRESVISDISAQQYRITVKAYMTRKATPEFDFMARWNNDNPMPMRTMTGTIEKETRGMVYMNLHGVGEPVIRCMRCGRELTNPISRHYGIGPECMSKLGLVADITDVAEIKRQFTNVKWSGWIIRSAITEKEEV